MAGALNSRIPRILLHAAGSCPRGRAGWKSTAGTSYSARAKTLPAAPYIRLAEDDEYTANLYTFNNAIDVIRNKFCKVR